MAVTPVRAALVTPSRVLWAKKVRRVATIMPEKDRNSRKALLRTTAFERLLKNRLLLLLQILAFRQLTRFDPTFLTIVPALTSVFWSAPTSTIFGPTTRTALVPTRRQALGSSG